MSQFTELALKELTRTSSMLKTYAPEVFPEVNELGTGRPVATGIELTCQVFLGDRDNDTGHSFTQDKWQPVRDAVVKWCDARVDFQGR